MQYHKVGAKSNAIPSGGIIKQNNPITTSGSIMIPPSRRRTLLGLHNATTKKIVQTKIVPLIRICDGEYGSKLLLFAPKPVINPPFHATKM